MSINDKIKQVLLTKNLSPSYLADDIGVQRSSISHILSGRNRPSLDIIQKIVRRFPEFTYEWFLEDDVQLLTEPSIASSPSINQAGANRAQPRPDTIIAAYQTNNAERTVNLNRPIIPKQNTLVESTLQDQQPIVRQPTSNLDKQIDRILVFYTDGTFREYMPT
jgi:transcriptional regulator with XRE-family HTH domain